MAASLAQTFILMVLAMTCETVTVKFESEYFRNTTLICDDSLLGLPYTTFKKYWILPDETILQPEHQPDGKFVVGPTPGFNLTIMDVNSGDKGWYRCVILWDNYIYLVHSINVGLNIDKEEDFYEKYEKEILYGGLAAGGLFLLLFVGCTSKYCCSTERKRRRDDDDDDDDIIEEEIKAIEKLDRTVRSFDDSSIYAGDQVVGKYRTRPRSGYVRSGYGNSVSSVASRRILQERKRSERDERILARYRDVEDKGLCFQNETFVLEDGMIVPYAPSDTDTLDRIPDNFSDSSER